MAPGEKGALEAPEVIIRHLCCGNQPYGPAARRVNLKHSLKGCRMTDFLQSLSREQLMALAEVGLSRLIDVDEAYLQAQQAMDTGTKDTLSERDLSDQIQGIRMEVRNDEAEMNHRDVDGVASEAHQCIVRLTDALDETKSAYNKVFVANLKQAIQASLIVGQALYDEGLSPRQWWETASELGLEEEVWVALLQSESPDRLKPWLEAAPGIGKSIFSLIRAWESLGLQGQGARAQSWLPVLLEEDLGETVLPYNSNKKTNLNESRTTALTRSWGKFCARQVVHPHASLPALINHLAQHVPTGWQHLDWETMGQGERPHWESLIHPRGLVHRIQTVMTLQPRLSQAWFDAPLLEDGSSCSRLTGGTHYSEMKNGVVYLKKPVLDRVIKDNEWEGGFGASFSHFQKLANSLDSLSKHENTYASAFSAFLLDRRWQAAPSRPKPRV